MYEARLGVGRVGGFRLGDYRPYVLLTVDGVARRLQIEHLSIRDTEGGIPNTATVRVHEFEPDEGQAIRIGLGALDGNHDIFAGHILTKRRVYMADKVQNTAYDLSCISWEWRLNRHTVNKRYTSTSATAIFIDLMQTYAPDFTTDGVEASLPDVEEITFTNIDLTQALDRLTDRIGALWGVSEEKDAYCRLNTSEAATTIDDINFGASRVTFDRDLSGVRTRVTVEGAGVTASAPAAPGDTALAVADLLWYDDLGGIVTSGPQRITYTGTVAGGAGALVGTTVTPTNGPTPALRAATGLAAGTYYGKTVFVTASGKTLPSPPSAPIVLGGALPAPATAPTATKQFGGSLSAGPYQWKYAYITASGETLTSGASSSVTMDNVSAPSSIGTASWQGGTPPSGSHLLSYKFTFRNGSVETTPSPRSNEVNKSTSYDTTGAFAKLGKTGNTAPPSGFERVFYRTKDDGVGTTWYEMPGASDGFETDDGSFYYEDDIFDSMLGSAVPSSNTATYRSASVSLVASSHPTVTGIRVYRTVAGGSVFKKVADTSNSTGTYLDTTADGSLGSTELGTATALYLAIDWSGISIGPSGTTQRELYRTHADAGISSTYNLVTTIANNTATTDTDQIADGSLGAAAPTVDTSGLTTAAGEVAAGSTSIPVTSTGFARSTGGWAFIGSMPIRYTGFSGTDLTGIPALGQDGSLGTTVKFGVEIVAAPLLVGIPASGVGAIQYAIATGDDVNLIVTEDDLDAQDALTELLTESGEPSADGVVEDYIQDRRLSSTEATNRAQAQLALVKDPLVTVRYDTFDPLTRSGREVTFTSTLLGLTGTFKIQSVTMVEFDGAQNQFPRRQVVATSRRFSFESLLRQGRT